MSFYKALSNTTEGDFDIVNTSEGYQINGDTVLGRIGTNFFLNHLSTSIQPSGHWNYMTGSSDSLISGDLNCAYGEGALQNNTTGSSNSAFGSNSSLNCDTGLYNSSFGANSLFENTDAAECTAIGVDSLYNNQGSENLGIGYASGDTNISGIRNTFLGNATNNSTDSGINRSCIGYSAINSYDYSCQIGSSDVSLLSLGNRTIMKNPNSTSILIGCNNTVSYTGTSNFLLTTVQENTPVTSGYNNVCITDAIPSVVTTGRGNIIIGKGAGHNAAGAGVSGTYNCIIGEDALGTGSTRGAGQAVNQCFALGYNTFQNAITSGGSSCVAIGHTAGNNIHNATKLTMIGHSSKSTYIPGLINSSAIGADSTITKSNEIVLGAPTVTLVRSGGAGVCSLGDITNPFTSLTLDTSLIAHDGTVEIGTSAQPFLLSYVNNYMYLTTAGVARAGEVFTTGVTTTVTTSACTVNSIIQITQKYTGGLDSVFHVLPFSGYFEVTCAVGAGQTFYWTIVQGYN